MTFKKRLGERIRLRLPAARRGAGGGRPESGPARPGRTREDWRLILVVLAMMLVYGAVGLRMGLLALIEPVEPRMAGGAGVTTPLRGEIADRNGNLLAANLPAFSLYVDPAEIKDPAGVADDLAAIFPDDDREQLFKRLSRKARFAWIKRPVTPRSAGPGRAVRATAAARRSSTDSTPAPGSVGSRLSRPEIRFTRHADLSGWTHRRSSGWRRPGRVRGCALRRAGGLGWCRGIFRRALARSGPDRCAVGAVD